MNLKIVSVHEKGKGNEEYVLIDVLQDCDTSYYGLADTTFTNATAISNKLRHFFWFPTKAVKRGDLIVLRTGVGTDDTFVNAAGTTVHRFFWRLGSAVWNNTGDAAVLFQVSSWATTKA